MELMSLEQALRTYGLSFKDILRAGITVYQWIGGEAVEYTDTRIYGSLGDLYIDKKDFLKLKDIRTAKKVIKAKKGKSSKDVIDLNSLKDKRGKQYGGYSPASPWIEE